LINELNSCYAVETNEIKIEDNSLLIRGCNNQVINRVGARFNFDQTGEEEWKRPPPVMLMIEQIYGV
jgi:hypothetical protein